MFTSTCLPKIQRLRGVYGTRDALQEELEKTMVELGFQLIVSTLRFYYHPSLGIRVVGHVDDLMCVAPRSGSCFWRS